MGSLHINLRVAAAVETSTLLVLVLNLATMHLSVIASALGPIHGAAYVSVIVCAALLRRGRGVIGLAVIPGVGGLLATRALNRRETADA